MDITVRLAIIRCILTSLVSEVLVSDPIVKELAVLMITEYDNKSLQKPQELCRILQL